MKTKKNDDGEKWNYVFEIQKKWRRLYTCSEFIPAISSMPLLKSKRASEREAESERKESARRNDLPKFSDVP